MENETTINHCTPPDAKHVLADELQWDESRAEDKEFLKLWYQSQLDKWSKQPKEIGGKIVAHYKKAIRELS
jgi:hypothetical protein